ncbi:MAG: addiction module protein [Gemmataceae bacterium]
MQTKVDTLFQEAMTLPDRDRAALAERILDSLPEEIAQAWSEVAEQRVDAMLRGEMEEIPYEEGVRRVQEARKRGRSL